MKWKQIVAFAIFASVGKVPLEFWSVSIQNIGTNSREICQQLLLILPFGVAIPLQKSKFEQFGRPSLESKAWTKSLGGPWSRTYLLDQSLVPRILIKIG